MKKNWENLMKIVSNFYTSRKGIDLNQFSKRASMKTYYDFRIRDFRPFMKRFGQRTLRVKNILKKLEIEAINKLKKKKHINLNLEIKNQNKIAYESPYDKKIRINNTNYTNDNINQDSSSNKKKISPFNYNINSNFYRQTSNKQDNIKNNLYNPNNDINSSYPNENKKMSIGQEKNNSYNQKNNIKNNSNKKKEQKRTSTPLGLSLYEKAKEYKDKLNNKYNEEQNYIIINANKKKIKKIMMKT